MFAVGPIQSMQSSKLYSVAPSHRKPNGLSQVLVPVRLFVEISFGETIASVTYMIRISIERAGGTAGAHQFVPIAK